MSSRLVCAALVLLSLAAPAFAQQGKRYALLVGVTEYDSSVFTKLKYAENDAEKLADVLKEAGYDEVVVLTSSRGKKDDKLAPTAANVRAALSKLSDKVKRDDLLLFGLSGHGVLWPVVDEKTKKELDESFFCPSDAKPRSGKTLDELKKTMLPLGELFRTLDESGAGVRLMLVDACRNEVKGEARNIDFDHLPRTKKGTAILFSCKAGERAFEAEKYKHGVFFHHVIEALKSKKNLTWSQLADHVADKVTEDVPELIGKGAKQTPHEIKNLEGRSPILLPRVSVDAAERLYREAMDAYQGLTKEIDEGQALTLFRQAAAKGHPLAGGWEGWMLHSGIGTASDKAEGLRLIKKAAPSVGVKAEEGSADAQSLLALLLELGLGVDKDHKKAAELQGKAAAKGNAIAMYHLSRLYAIGRGVEKDNKTADEWLQKAADKGSVQAMDLLTMKYFHLRGKENEKKAAELSQKAADKGSISGMVFLAELYVQGRGVTTDKKKAFDLYQKAANKGSAHAMYRQGLMYGNGEGVDKDEKKAAQWHQKAADKGDSWVRAVLGALYSEGRGVERDEKKAAELEKKAAADLGAIELNAIGAIFKYGLDVAKNEKKAAQWFAEAAAKGHVGAMVDLAKMCESGEGVPKSRSEALKWYKKAAALGDDDAKKKVKELEGKE